MNPAARPVTITMTALDLGPATRATAALVAGVRDDQLGDPTPCPAYSVGDLLDHLGGLSVAFTEAALKDTPEGGHEPRPTARGWSPGSATGSARLSPGSPKPGALPARSTG